MGIFFSKMHGIGNDFAIVDARGRALPGLETIRKMADRHTGIGFDQMMIAENPACSNSLAAYRIYNADGSEAKQCGNGVRCLAAWLKAKDGLPDGTYYLDGPAGRVACSFEKNAQIKVNMGKPVFEPALVPYLGAKADDLHHLLPLPEGDLAIGIANMGNPHAVVEVDDVQMVQVQSLGKSIETHPAFPDRVNVGFAQVVDERLIKLRVFERGTGETLACGSGACAAVAVLARRGKVSNSVAVDLPGGRLIVEWAGKDADVWMTGPTAFVYEGEWLQ